MDTNQNIQFASGWLLRKDGQFIPANLVDPAGVPSADWLLRLLFELQARKQELAINTVEMLPGPIGTSTPTISIKITFDTGRVKDLDAYDMLMATIGMIRPSPAGWAPYYDYNAAFAKIISDHVSIAKG